MYKLILCDLDATLLDDSKNVPQINLECIKLAVEMGCRFVLSSGRSNMSLNNFNKDLGLDKKGCYCIGYNGGIIYEADTLRVLSEHLLKGELAVRAIRLCRNYEVDLMVYYNENLYLEKPSERIDIYARRSKLVPICLDNLESICINNVSKVIIIGRNSILKSIEKDVYTTGLNKEITTFFSAADLYEFNPLNIDKGTALDELSAFLNIDKKDIIAIGDNMNDISMVKKAGLGVAVRNGTDEIKSTADYITEKTNNEGAVAEVIEKFVLNMEINT